MTLNEAAEALGVDPSTLRHQIKNGRLRASKVGPVWTVTPGELARYRSTSLGQPGARRRPTGSKARKRKAVVSSSPT